MSAQTSATDFGSVAIGSSNSLPVTLTMQSPATLSSIVVMTNGAQGLDFANAGTGTCVTNLSYSAGQTCTVGVTFTPKFSGARYGAAVAYNMSGDVVATGYALGTGNGPQVSFLPGTESALTSIAVSGPHGIAVDGSGNIYVANSSGLLKETYANGTYTATTISTALYYATSLAVDGAGNLYVADWGNGQVVKEVPTAGGYKESIIDSNVGWDYGVAVDGSGNVYVSDAEYGRVLKETPTANGYTRSVIVTGLSNAQAIAVDGAGNIYVGDKAGIHKEVQSQGAYVQAGSAFGRPYPNGIQVDAAGNVYYSDMSTYNIFKDTPTANGYVENAAVTDLHAILGPFGLSLDGSGKLYIAYLGGKSIVTANFAVPPALNFAETEIGATSSDSPQTVVIFNDGNAPLNIEIPVTGQNPSIDSSFTLASGGASDCPIVTAGASSTGTVAAASMCQLSISYTAQISGPIFGAAILTDDNLNAVGPEYALQSITLNGTTTPSTFTISPRPSSLSVTQGGAISSTITITPLPGFNVNANLSVSGLPSGVTATFSQNPVSSATTLTLTASSAATPGNVTLTITGTTGSDTETALIDLQVNAVPSYYLTFSSSPAYLNLLAGSSGTATLTTTTNNGYSSAVSLSICSMPLPTGVSLSLNPALISAPGSGSSTMTISVSSNAGAGSYVICLAAEGNGIAQTLNFILNVSQTPVITWPTPAAIAYGTQLSSTQLNATTNVLGTFAYSPAAGALLSAGTHTLTATFTPTDTTKYTSATKSVSILVNEATPAITWPAPAAIVYGTALSAVQLNATTTVPGTFSYSPAVGTVLSAGTQTLTVTFTPTDSANYTTASASVSLTVSRATPTITWPAPAAIVYGTALSAKQLNAKASVAGTFTYSPAAGTLLAVGTYSLTATFAPTDAVNYAPATAQVPLTVIAPFKLSASTTNMAVKQGSSATSTITVTRTTGFTGGATLSVSGLPSGVTAKFSRNPATGSSVLTLSASSNAMKGTYTIVLQGTYSGYSTTIPIMMNITARR